MEHHPRMTAMRRTICEVHKELHDIAYEYIEDDDIRTLALKKIGDVYDMAKRMDNKLKEYKYPIANKEWRGWDRVSPYRLLISFYRRARKLGKQPKDPYRLEAEDLKKGIVRDPKKGLVRVEEVWPKELEIWKNIVKK